MAEFTEHYHLKKPEDAEYYDVADFNGNMDIIDAALAGNTGGAEAADKIGEPADALPETVFGKLNGYISADGKGVRIIKSIQRIVCSNTGSANNVAIRPVDPERCIVLTERLYNSSEYLLSYSYDLKADTLTAHVSGGSTQSCRIGFWIIEFY